VSVVPFGCLLAILALAPLPLGSNRPWAWSLLTALLAATTLLWAIASMAGMHGKSVRLLPIAIVVPFLVAAAWAALQIFGPVPDSWIHPLWDMAAARLPGPVSMAMSVDPNRGLSALVRLLGYGLAFVLGFHLCRTRRQCRGLLIAVAGAAFAYSLFGLYVEWTRADFHWFGDVYDATGRVTSTFVNRNHFATYAGLGLLCTISLLIESHLGPMPGPRLTSLPRSRHPVERIVERSWLPLLVIAVVGTALLLSRSRAGILATIAGATVLALASRRRRTAGGSGRIPPLLWIVPLALVFVVSGGGFLDRMTSFMSGVEGRKLLYGNVVEAVGSNPWLGFGLGSFANAFGMYRDEAVPGYNLYAHNSYLEAIFELGIPAGTCLVLSVVAAFLVCLQGIGRRRRDWIFPATGAAAAVLAGSHALVDFSLQIPAVAVTFAVLLGAAVAQSYPSAPDP
jgi:O-antigen ligase